MSTRPHRPACGRLAAARRPPAARPRLSASRRVPDLRSRPAASSTHRVVAEGVPGRRSATQVGIPSQVRHGGRILWMAEDGTDVEAGQVVMRLDHYELEQQLERELAELGTRTSIGVAPARRDVPRSTAPSRARTSPGSSSSTPSASVATTTRCSRAARSSTRRSPRSWRARVGVEPPSSSRSRASGRAPRSTASTSRAGWPASRSISRAPRCDALELRAPRSGILIWSRDWRGETARIGDRSCAASRRRDPRPRRHRSRGLRARGRRRRSRGRTSRRRSRSTPHPGRAYRRRHRPGRAHRASAASAARPRSTSASPLELDRMDPAADEAGPAGAAVLRSKIARRARRRAWSFRPRARSLFAEARAGTTSTLARTGPFTTGQVVVESATRAPGVALLDQRPRRGSPWWRSRSRRRPPAQGSARVMIYPNSSVMAG